MRRILLVFVLTALLLAVVFSGSALAQLQPPFEKGCRGIERAGAAQRVNPTDEDREHSALFGPKSVTEKHKCKA